MSLPVWSRVVKRAAFAAIVVSIVAPPETRAQSAPAAPAAPASGQPPSVDRAAQAKPPVFNRVNDLLPAWLRVRGEFRERMEGADNAGFTAGRDDLYWLSRFRFDATVTASNRLRGYVQVQDARVARKSLGATGTPFSAPFDVRAAYLEVGDAQSAVSVRGGRQELAFGEQRLIGHLNWTNAARTFDGARATIRAHGLQLDVFEASVVRILDGELDKSGQGNRLGGVYATSRAWVPRATVEPFVFWRRDERQAAEMGAPGDSTVATTGVRVAGRLPARLDYDVELALQRGSIAHERVRAWAGHWRVRQAFAGAGAVRAIAEYNVASGDRDPTDRVRGTFDQLYPTGHDKYGLADQVGWRNVHHLRIGADFTPFAGLPISTSYHSWWLNERRDGLYTAGGTSIARVAAGALETHVGQEIDVQVSRQLTPQIQLAAGYAHLVPGAFLRASTPGASYSFPYVMMTYVLLAER